MPTRLDSIKQYYTLIEAHVATGISHETWRWWVQSRKVACVRASRNKILIPASEIQRIMQEGYHPRKQA